MAIKTFLVLLLVIELGFADPTGRKQDDGTIFDLKSADNV